MGESAPQMKLGLAVLPTGNHAAGWRLAGAHPDGGVNFRRYVEIVQKSEAAKLDFIFLPDSCGIRNADRIETLSRLPLVVSFEPITLLSALAAVTDHIGLIATASTSFNEPYNIARTFASLDLISGGRAGWNLVTSANDAEARNFNLDQHLAHDARYRRAAEFGEVVLGLWDSWEDGALILDPGSGLFVDPGKAHFLRHKGPHFSVEGPLNVPPSPQRRPVMVQAGASDDGRALAASMAEVVFTAQRDLASAKAFYRDVKEQAQRLGRDPKALKVMPGVMVVTGETEAEAKAKQAKLAELIHVDLALAMLSITLGGVDLSPYPLDGPVPDLPLTNGPQSRQQLLLDTGRRNRMTLRQLAHLTAEGHGHGVVVGSPAQVADHFERWFGEGAADGFTVLPPSLPGSLDDFAALVVPELRRRGLFRSEYEGATLRENLGLPAPPNRYAVRKAAAE